MTEWIWLPFARSSLLPQYIHQNSPRPHFLADVHKISTVQSYQSNSIRAPFHIYDHLQLVVAGSDNVIAVGIWSSGWLTYDASDLASFPSSFCPYYHHYNAVGIKLKRAISPIRYELMFWKLLLRESKWWWWCGWPEVWLCAVDCDTKFGVPKILRPWTLSCDKFSQSVATNC